MQEIAKALIKFHFEVGKIKKDADNPFFKSKYASLSNILDVVTPALIASDLVVVQMPVGEGKLRTILLHASGENIESEFDMKIVKNDPQSLGSAITYARRYAIGAILSLNIDDDDDANSATPQAGEAVEKDWLNATNKAGELNDMGGKVAQAIAEGKRSWADLEAKYKVSKKDREAINAMVDNFKQLMPNG
jgi:hypothetical protein